MQTAFVGYLRRHFIALLALFIALGGTSYALSDPSAGPLYACVTRAFHTLNLTSASATCPQGQSKISWDRTGARGGQGPPGNGAATVYQGDIKSQSPIVLGPQSNPTHIVDTPPLPVGTYLVSYSVGFVFGRLDNAVCAAGVGDGHGNDGVFGVGGNGSTESGTGAAGIYGNGVAFDTLTVTKNGERIEVFCNSANPTKGTYSGGATITAVPVRDLVIDHQ